VHVTPEGYAMWEIVVTDEDIEQWERVRQNYQWKPQKLRRLRPPLPDGTPAPAYCEDIAALSGCWKKLAANGITYVYELGDMTRKQVGGIKGVGKVAVANIEAVLADHGMTFKGEEAKG
jgi:DNA-directed RNA polymerase alpha subunit